jgi:RHS repeat-associated protein
VIPGHGNDDGYHGNPDDDDDDADPSPYLESFTYRADNMLVGYQKNQEQAWTYTYDALTRRVAKERVKEHGRPAYEAWQKDETTYLGLSDTILRDSTEWKTWRTHVSQNALDYLVGPGGRACGAEEAYWWRGYGYGNRGYAEDRFYHYDIRGGLSAITFDKPGLSGTRLEYDAFGNLEGGSFNASFQWQGLQHSVWETVGYAGQRYDRESGLYAYKYRSYDPEVGQWLEEDPIRAGEAWYEFCAGNPVRFTDPDGLHECEIANDGYQMEINPIKGGVDAKGYHLNTDFQAQYKLFAEKEKYDMHAGFDFVSKERAVVASLSGTVLFAGEHPDGTKRASGSLVLIRYEDDTIGLYGHMDPKQLKIAVGDTVSQGQDLGLYADYIIGKSTGPHLHYARYSVAELPEVPDEIARYFDGTGWWLDSESPDELEIPNSKGRELTVVRSLFSR